MSSVLKVAVSMVTRYKKELILTKIFIKSAFSILLPCRLSGVRHTNKCSVGVFIFIYFVSEYKQMLQECEEIQ